ncbi:MAG: archease [Candidatus Kuenenia sp.]|nr:archease [Candidatus Kuenenia hertensis]
MHKYKLIDHTADIGIDIFGGTLKELFSNAGYAMFDIITDLSSVDTKNIRTIAVEGIDREQLLVNWLSELLYLHEVKNMLFKEFCIDTIEENQLSATLHGELLNEKKHIIKTGIKAVTYHNLSIKKENDHWKARVIFDL